MSRNFSKTWTEWQGYFRHKYLFSGNLLNCVTGRRVSELHTHDDEGVALKFAGIAITEERGDEEFCVCGALEDSAALVGESG